MYASVLKNWNFEKVNFCIKWYFCKKIHTYIYIGHYNHSIRITIKFLTPLTFCVLILCMCGGTYSLKSTSNDRFLRNFFMAILFGSRIFARRRSPKKYFFFVFFIFCFVRNVFVWHGVWTMESRLGSPHATYYNIYLFIFNTHTEQNIIHIRNRTINDLFISPTYKGKIT